MDDKGHPPSTSLELERKLVKRFRAIAALSATAGVVCFLYLIYALPLIISAPAVLPIFLSILLAYVGYGYGRQSLEMRSLAVMVANGGRLVPSVGPTVSRAGRAFSWFAILAPRRVWQEETGDALEVIAAMERAGCSTFKIRLKIWSTIFWVLLNGVRETIAALTGRKSPHK